MKVKVTNAEALNLFQMLSNLKAKGNDKFVYAIAKNRSILKRTVEAIQAEGNSYADGSERFKEYQTRSESLLRQFAVDADGKPSMQTAGDGVSLQRVVPKEKVGDFMVAREMLDAEFKDALLGFELHQAAFQKYLRAEIEVDLHVLKMKNIPDEMKDTQYMNLMYVFVDEDEHQGELIPFPVSKKEPSLEHPPAA